MEITKVCHICGQVKSFDELVKNKNSSYGVEARCIECSRAQARKYYAENTEKARKAMRTYADANREKIRKQQKKWVDENHDRLKEYHAQWRAKHPENAEKVKETNRKWRIANPGKPREQRQNWLSKEGNRERQLAATRNRRARKRKAPGKHTAADIRHQLELQSGCCYWCGESLNNHYHVDHVIPLIRGGSNDPWNIVCTCVKCNCSKGDKIPYVEWQPPNPLFPNEHRP